MSFVNSDGMLVSDKVVLRRFYTIEHGDLHGVGMTTIKAWPIGALLALTGCTNLHTPDLESIVISSFQSQEPESCRPSDVPFDPNRVQAFFQRASQIDSRTLHDRYEWAPCYLEGNLKYNGHICTWQVRAGATGLIQCPASEQYFACDECDDLFEKPGQ